MVLAVSMRAISKYFSLGSSSPIIPALNGVDLDIQKGTFSALIGPSGSGKTTLLNVIGGLERPSSGAIFVDGIDLNYLSARQLANFRCHKVGYVHQTFDLQPVLTAQENVELPMVFAGKAREFRKKRAQELLWDVELRGYERRRPNQLSGGQQQRVAIARALTNDPILLLADEPTANLDLQTGTAILQLLRDLNRNEGKTLLIATHDMDLVLLVNRIITIQDGKISVKKNQEEVNISSIAG
ncbi:MAG: ABC transporter ATP-binding protein [Candidatus Hodarchaeales archaeon]|jgi:putative ABC transport system ATP-binding protein